MRARPSGRMRRRSPSGVAGSASSIAKDVTSSQFLITFGLSKRSTIALSSSPPLQLNLEVWRAVTGVDRVGPCRTLPHRSIRMSAPGPPSRFLSSPMPPIQLRRRRRPPRSVSLPSLAIELICEVVSDDRVVSLPPRTVLHIVVGPDVVVLARGAVVRLPVEGHHDWLPPCEVPHLVGARAALVHVGAVRSDRPLGPGHRAEVRSGERIVARATIDDVVAPISGIGAGSSPSPPSRVLFALLP